MSIDQPRQPAGVPVGGQFAATSRTEPALDLIPDGQPALLTPALIELVDHAVDEYEGVCREFRAKGRESQAPRYPNLGTLAEKLAQMTDEDVEFTTETDAAQVRAEFARMLAQMGAGTPLDGNVLDVPIDPPGPVDLDAWAPGTDERTDGRVAAELLLARARIAQLESDAEPVSGAEAHIRRIGQAAGFHPTQGVMPAVLLAIHDRGEDDDEWALRNLKPEDLGAMYDAHIGPALDHVQDDWRDIVEQRTGVAAMTEQLQALTSRWPGDFDHRAAAREIHDTWRVTDIDDVDHFELQATVRRHLVD